MLIIGGRQLQAVLAEYLDHDNGHRPHRALGQPPPLGSFTQSYGSSRLDASLLLLPLVGFLPPHDPRIRGTLKAVQAQLSSDGFLLRYRPEQAPDGLPVGEGTFLPCSFWLVDALALDGRHDEAAELFEHLLGVRNDVGLLAEEYDPHAKRLLGNFPQALSHIALVTSAFNLARTANTRPPGADQRRTHRPPGLDLASVRSQETCLELDRREAGRRLIFTTATTSHTTAHDTRRENNGDSPYTAAIALNGAPAS
jgi:hypothetical protein